MPKKATPIGAAIDRALTFIADTQLADGGFASDSSPTKQPFVSNYTYRTTFVSALILAALAECEVVAAQTVRARLAQFLLAQKGPHWSFNYWARDSDEAVTLPYPDDLDDTFCALSALHRHDPSLVDEAALAWATKLLIAAETAPGGPYRTWLVSRGAPTVWQDVDLAVNANVAYFLALAVKPLPPLTKYLAEAIETRAFSSPYYPNEYPILYYLGRASTGATNKALATYILSTQQSGHWGSPLVTALSVSALLRLGQPAPESAVDFLLETQRSDGSWPAEAFCVDPTREGQAHFGGAAALTTAFAVEALSLHARQKPAYRSPAPGRSRLHPVVVRASTESKELSLELRRSVLSALSHAASGQNGSDILYAPRLMYESLRQQPRLSVKLFDDLALANLYGWASYTLHDDMLDGDSDIHVLPAANVLARRSFWAFEAAVPNDALFRQQIVAAFDAMDAANAWEVTRCRFVVRDGLIEIGTLPDYRSLSRLAERSFGATLPLLGVLAACGVSLDSPAAMQVQKALSHYLIARQLNDDAHDWQEDLRAGRMTYAVACILRGLSVAPGSYPLDDLVHRAEKQFWHHTLSVLCQDVMRHVRLSRKAIAASDLLTASSAFDDVLNGVEKVAQDTLRTLRQTEQFLAAYRQD